MQITDSGVDDSKSFLDKINAVVTRQLQRKITKIFMANLFSGSWQDQEIVVRENFSHPGSCREWVSESLHADNFNHLYY